MFENIGGKIKGLASVVCILGIIGSVISGISIIDYDGLSGFLIMVLGSVFSWAGSFVLYGFGQLVDNSDIIAGRMGSAPNQWPAQPPVQNNDIPPVQNSYAPLVQPSYQVPVQKPAVVPAGGWRCTCGRVHANYVSSCSCGVNKRDIN